MNSDTRERGVDIDRAQLRGFARSIAEVEWLLLVLIMAYLFVTRPPLANPVVVIGVLAGFAVFVIALRYAPRLRERLHLKIGLEILAMVALVTIVLSEIGGRASPLVNLYLLPIIAAALALGKRSTFLVTTLVCLCYLLLATIEVGLAALSLELFSEALGVLAPFVLVAFMTTLLTDDLQKAKRRIRDLSDRDELTNLLNLSAFMRLAARDHQKAAAKNGRYSILQVDVDQLKQINDTYGHDAGNKALRVVADALLRLTRSGDLVARFGGDEFVALLRGSDGSVATDVAQRLRSVVYAATFEVNLDIVRVQVSAGVANYPDDGDTLERVMAQADRAMYSDKKLRAKPEGALVIQKR